MHSYLSLKEGKKMLLPILDYKLIWATSWLFSLCRYKQTEPLGKSVSVPRDGMINRGVVQLSFS